MKWIDVNDEVPPTPNQHGKIFSSDRVLVWTDKGCEISRYSNHYEQTPDGLKFIKGLWMDALHITHWMELPNKP